MQKVVDIVKNTLLFSPKFPYRTGYLRNHFIDSNSTVITDNMANFTVLSNPTVNYGRILENAPSIRYKLRKQGNKQYTYIKHKNRHFRYIERIIDAEVVSALENRLGVERV